MHSEECRYAEAVVSALGDGAYVLDAGRTRVFVNDRLREVTGFEDDLLHAKHPERVVAEGYWSEEAGEQYRDAVERVLDGESDDERVQITTSLGTGDRVTTETRLTPLYDPPESTEGTPDGVVGVIRDVTERTERERELRKLNDRLERLTGFLSHDLRNPLAVASGYIDLARESGETDELDRAADAIDRAERLVTDVLVTLRDPDELDRRPVPVGDLARERWNSGDMGDRTADAEICIETDARVHADRELLRRALGNLIGNALDHAGEAPTVRVGVDDRGLYVADDGPGIPENRRGDVREFGTSDGGGTGIGLTIVETIAEHHGWDLTLEKSREGGLRATLVGVTPAELG